MVLVTKNAPEFRAEAVMSDNSFKHVSLSDYRGKYVILFFYPLDFTFVCPSEIIAFDKRLDEFEKRNAQVLGVSVDSVYSHFAWKGTPVNHGGIGPIRYPLIADINKRISMQYDVLHDESVALRGSFLIDKEGVVRHQVINDLPLGRNIDEMLRMIDTLQHFEKYGEVCPAGWKTGKKSIKPDTAGIKNYLASNSSDL